MRSVLLEKLLVTACILVGAVYLRPASASTIDCDASFTPAAGSTVKGNLEVLASSTPCVLSDVNVMGNVTVDTGGTLEVENNSKIGGNLTVNGGLIGLQPGSSVEGNATVVGVAGSPIPDSNYVGACGTKFGGSVTVENLTGASTSTGFVFGEASNDIPLPGITCTGNKVTGSLSVLNNAIFVEIGASTITGSVTVEGNTGTGPAPTQGSVEIQDNVIRASLRCSDNTSVAGQGTNTVKNSETGQCVKF